MRIKTVLLLLLLLAVTAPSDASNAPVSRKELSNGMTVLLQPDRSKDVAACTILLKLGVYEEEEYIVGIRTFLAELVEAKTDAVKRKDGLRAMEYLGVGFSSAVETDFMAFTVKSLPGDFENALDTLSRNLLDPVSDRELYEKTRTDFIEEQKKNRDSFSNIYNVFLSTFYRYHPYKLSKQFSLTALEKMPPEKAADFIETTFSSDKVIIAVSGNFSSDRVTDILEKRFAPMTAKPKIRADVQWEPESTEKELYLSSLSRMGWLLAGYHAPSYNSPDYPAMCVAKKVVGEGFNSRFWLELREKRGYAYELGAVYPQLEGPAHIMFYTVLQPSNASRAKRIILSIIDDVRKNKISEAELAVAKEKVLGEHLLTRESAGSFTLDSTAAQAIGGSYAVDMNFRKRVADVTADDVLRVCRKYFREPTVIMIRPPGVYLKDIFQ